MSDTMSEKSIYDQSNRPTVALQNPLDLYRQAGAAANAMNENKLFQARQAAGQAALGAIQPDGSFNQSQLGMNLRNDPNTALAAQETLTSGQALGAAQQKRSAEAQGNVAQTLISLGTQPDSAMNGETFRGAIQQRVQDRSMTQDDAAAAMKDLPPDGSNPAAYRLYILRHGTQNLTTPEGQKLLYGGNIQIDDGGKVQGGTQASPAMGGGLNVGGQSTVTKQTTPEFKDGFVTIQDPNGPPGQKITVRNSSIPGGSGSSDPSAFPNGGRNAPPPGSPLLKPGQGAASDPPPTPQAATSVAPQAAATIVDPDPNAIAKSKMDLDEYTKDKTAGVQSVGDRVTLNHALDALKVLKDATLTTGPTSDTMHRMFSTLQTYGALPPGMSDNVANWELAKKALTKYAASAGGLAHTNLGLDTAAASNASVDGVTNQTAQTVVKQAIGQINQSLSTVNDAPNKDGRGYTDHRLDRLQNTDPRAFNFDDYEPSERAAIIKSLGAKGSTAYKRFTAGLAIAHTQGMISPGQ